jgi:non-reducing end alpha-L-arabinofuranosidase
MRPTPLSWQTSKPRSTGSDELVTLARAPGSKDTLLFRDGIARLPPQVIVNRKDCGPACGKVCAMTSVAYFLRLFVIGTPLVGCNGGVDTGGTNAAGTSGTSTQPTSATGGISPAGGNSTQPTPATGGINAGGTGGAVSAGGSVATGGRAPSTGGAGVGGGNPPATGGTQPIATGGSNHAQTGGAATGGGGGNAATGGAATGGYLAGGALGTGGSTTGATGGSLTGGAKATGGTVATTGGAGNPPPITGPCDIYAAANPATPCVAAYSTTRLLNSTYSGPLYQVRKGGSSPDAGSTTRDIGTTVDGFANGAAQDAFCGTDTCTISILYDQSGKGNDLTAAPPGCYMGTASGPDHESIASQSSYLSGHKVYALYMNALDGYRNNATTGMPIDDQAQGIYEAVDGTRYGNACCWDFGNATTNNCSGGIGALNALFFGTAYWGKGAGAGPWFMADFETGVWAGGSGASSTVNPDDPSITFKYALGILKTNASSYAIRVGNAQSGSLTTAYDGALPFATWKMKGGIVLGISGDNSNSSYGTFFEGAITAGRPSDATDAAVLANVQAAKYGQ